MAAATETEDAAETVIGAEAAIAVETVEVAEATAEIETIAAVTEIAASVRSDPMIDRARTDLIEKSDLPSLS